jgi:sulfite exporter TauE/SafE
MKENLYYLFLSGIILGSGPCLVSCAPFLIFYTAAQKKGLKQSLFSYGVFSLGRLISYILWGLVCALGAASLQSEVMAQYTKNIYLALGFFIVLLGVATCFGTKDLFGKTCAILSKGNIRNVGVAGLLIGFSPCLPLIGMLNYVVLISKNSWEAMMYLFVFGLGTIFSPLVLLTAISGKLAQMFSKSENIRRIIQYVSGGILIFLGLRIIFILAR